MTDLALRDQMLHAAFTEVLTQERLAAQAQSELMAVTCEIKIRIGKAERAQEAAWAQIAEMMKETGEVEILIPGEGCNYKLAYSAVRQSVEVNEDAVPKEYCKEVLKPKLKEIKEMLESGTACNWARFKESEPKLTWRAVKF